MSSTHLNYIRAKFVYGARPMTTALLPLPRIIGTTEDGICDAHNPNAPGECRTWPGVRGPVPVLLYPDDMVSIIPRSPNDEILPGELHIVPVKYVDWWKRFGWCAVADAEGRHYSLSPEDGTKRQWHPAAEFVRVVATAALGQWYERPIHYCYGRAELADWSALPLDAPIELRRSGTSEIEQGDVMDLLDRGVTHFRPMEAL